MSRNQGISSIITAIVSLIMLAEPFFCANPRPVQDHKYPHDYHVFKLNECNQNDLYPEASTQYTDCHISAPPYYEYELVTLTVEHCNISSSYGPLVYQLYGSSLDTGEVFPISVPQLSDVFVFPGLPAMDEASQENTYAVKFCDAYNYCDMIFTDPIQVYANENKTVMINELLKLAKRYNNGGYPFHALGILGVVLKEKHLDSGILFQSMANSIEYSLGILQRPSQLLTTGEVSLYFWVLSEFIRKSRNNMQREKALDSIHRLTEKAFSLETIPDLMTLRSTSFNILLPYTQGIHPSEVRDTQELSRVMKAGRKTFKILLQMVAAQLALGKSIGLGSLNGRESDVAVGGAGDGEQEPPFKTVMVHGLSIEDATIQMGDLEVTIKMGQSVKRRFSSPWACSIKTDGEMDTCDSIVYAYTVFPLSGPFPEIEEGYRIAPILMVDIFAPDTGKIQQIRGDLNAIEMAFHFTGNPNSGGPDYLTKCQGWDEKKDSWRVDGVHLLETSEETISCWSGHIAPFTVYRVPQKWNIGSVLFMIFAGLLLLIIIGFWVIIRSQDKPSPHHASSQRLIFEPGRDLRPVRRTIE